MKGEGQNITVVKDLAASNPCDDVSDPHCSISQPTDNINHNTKTKQK